MQLTNGIVHKRPHKVAQL